jgi:hypothetical protein
MKQRLLIVASLSFFSTIGFAAVIDSRNSTILRLSNGQISVDCYKKPHILINGQFPGPTVRVRSNSTLHLVR